MRREGVHRRGPSGTDAEDVRRFAEAALGAAGDGWRGQASMRPVDRLAAGRGARPCAAWAHAVLRSRLVAGWAAVCSHHKPVDECEAAATKALAIARAVDDQRLIAGRARTPSRSWSGIRRGTCSTGTGPTSSAAFRNSIRTSPGIDGRCRSSLASRALDGDLAERPPRRRAPRRGRPLRGRRWAVRRVVPPALCAEVCAATGRQHGTLPAT